jgi:hypothetical protein
MEHLTMQELKDRIESNYKADAKMNGQPWNGYETNMEFLTALYNDCDTKELSNGTLVVDDEILVTDFGKWHDEHIG